MITVLDRFYPQNIHQKLVDYRTSIEYKLSRSDNEGVDVYLSRHCFGVDYNTKTESDWRDSVAKDAFEYFVSKVKLPDSAKLESCYFNNILFGQSAYPHKDQSDFEEHGSVTVITYVTDAWSVCLGGETLFWDSKFDPDPTAESMINKDPIAAVSPKPDRVVVFDGNIMHGVRPVTHLCKGGRTTLMFKFINVKFDELKFPEPNQG